MVNTLIILLTLDIIVSIVRIIANKQMLKKINDMISELSEMN